MKTYLLNIPDEIKKISQGLDAKALLCKKTWEVFNDEGDKQVWIFQNNGNLIISNNGDATNATWQFFPANTSILITAEGQSTLLRPVMVDGIIFAMQKDGTQECLFLIDEHEHNICPHRTLTELEAYFAPKQLEESIDNAEIKRIEQEKKEKLKKEQERTELIVKEHQDEIEALVKQRKSKSKKGLAIAGGLLLISALLTIVLRKVVVFGVLFLMLDLLAFVFVVVFALIWMSAKENSENDVITKYK